MIKHFANNGSFAAGLDGIHRYSVIPPLALSSLCCSALEQMPVLEFQQPIPLSPQLTAVQEETKPFCFYFYSGLMLRIERIKREPYSLVW